MALPDDLTHLLSCARNERARRQHQINHYLRFADPTSPRVGDDVKKPVDRAEEADDLFDTTMQEVAEDFASDLIGRIMPRQADWLTYAPLDAVPDEIKAQIKEPLKQRSTTIFDSIRSSNFYDEAAGEWALNQGHGTSGLMIVDPGAGRPFYCEAIPPYQLLILRGARGINFIARECAWELGEAVTFWPTYKWTKRQKDDARDKTKKRVRHAVVQSATLIPDPGDEKWLWRVCVGDELVHEETLTGTGSCPIMASRWRTHASSPWGLGPLLKAVPDALTLDQERYLVLQNLGEIVKPPVVYDDDGVLNPEGGVGAGDWIPRVPGSKVDRLEPGRVEAAYYEQGQLQDNIRRAGFQSGPRQRGKTPPTLGQWLDEKSEEGRRLEMPTGKLYAEGVIAITQRFEYLLIRNGTIDPFLSVRSGAPIRVRPMNPLARQQDYEEVQVAQQLLQAGNAIFGPQAMAALVDGGKTFEAFKEKLNDGLIAVRPAEQADEYMRGVLGQPGSAPGLETVPGEA
ncbi:hypothetical protein IWC96_14445 [Brevundimonas sp. BAL450]|uniref:portal protein n=1 Tax=Brevundimonas sp. BAL450 TaxID=1708162 RepID=UPI0018C97C66|nr:portal protein [Brevundimonas sp. BAL450]MBG7616474.1 hypothetical protein [Brevundimonas sp. BAL450]